MATMLRISLLGGFEARTASGELVRLPGKVAALLAYLAMTGDRGQPRESLAGLVWQEGTESRARGSLRQALTVLRQALGPLAGALTADRRRVQLAACATEVDALCFEQQAGLDTPDALEKAVTLYRGDFLQGLEAGSRGFDEWASAERIRLQEMYKSVLIRLAAHFQTSGELGKAIDTALRLLAIDPLREDAHRMLIGLYLGAERRGDALRQFERCRETLRRELQTEPESATRRLVEGAREPTPALLADHSVAVLPFRLVGAGGRAATAAFILREGLEFSLSRFRDLRTVIVRRVERAPQTRFVVEGSIEQHEQALLIGVRLLETATGRCLWEGQFRKHRDEYLEIEQSVVRRIAACIHPAIIDRSLAAGSRGGRLDGRGLALLARAEAGKLTASSLQAAIQLAKRAIALDAGNSLAFGTLALARVSQIRMGWSTARCLPEAVDAAAEALVLDYGDPIAHGVRGLVHLWERQHEAGLRNIARGLELNPNHAELLHWYGLGHDYSEQPDKALELHRAAIELAPRHPWAFAATNAIAGASYEMEAFDDAVHWARQSIAMNPSYRRSHVVLAASLGRLRDEAGARRALAKAHALDPSLCLRMQLSGLPYNQSRPAASWERGYRAAGLR